MIAIVATALWTDRYMVAEARSMVRIKKSLELHDNIVLFTCIPPRNAEELSIDELVNYQNKFDIIIWDNEHNFSEHFVEAGKHYLYCWGWHVDKLIYPDKIDGVLCQSKATLGPHYQIPGNSGFRKILLEIPFEKSYVRQDCSYILCNGNVQTARRLELIFDACLLSNSNLPLKVVYNFGREYFLSDSDMSKGYYSFLKDKLNRYEPGYIEYDNLCPLEFEELVSKASVYMTPTNNGSTITEALCYGVPVISPRDTLDTVCKIPMLFDSPGYFDAIWDVKEYLDNYQKYSEEYKLIGLELSEKLTYANVGKRLINQL